MARLIWLVAFGLAIPAAAYAGECAPGAASNDCDGDGVLDDGLNPDRCPFTASVDNSQTSVTYVGTTTPLPTGTACTDAGASVAPGATVGFGVELGPRSIVLDGAVIGDFAVIGGGVEDAVIAPRAQIASALTPDQGSIVVSGVVSRASLVGTDVHIADGVVIGRQVQIGSGSRLSDDVAVGFGTVLDGNNTLGAGATLGSLAGLEDGASVGPASIVARGTQLGLGATVHDNVIIGPDGGIGAGATIGAVSGAVVRVRKDATLGAGVVVSPGARVARSVVMGPGSVLGTDGRLSARSIVGEGATVSEDAHVLRLGTVCDFATVPPGDLVPAETTFPDEGGCVGAIRVLDASRAGTGGLDPAAGTAGSFETWLHDQQNNGLGAEVTGVPEFTASALSGADLVILIMDGQVSNAVLSAAERTAIGDFVRDGGGLVVFFGYQGTDSIGSEFGFTMFHGAGNNGLGCWSPGNASPTAAMPAAIQNGPYGTVGTITWTSNCHENIDFGTSPMVALTSGLSDDDIAMIAPGDLELGSGPVITFMDYANTYQAENHPSALSAVRNSVLYALTQ